MTRRFSLSLLLLIVVLTAGSTGVYSQLYSISGRIEIEGRSDHSGIIVWVDELHSDMTGPTGDFEIRDISSGEYIIYAWAHGCLSSSIDTISVSGSDVIGVSGSLFPGDVHPDGRINLHDSGEILTALNATPDSVLWNSALDLDGNSVIDSLDLSLLVEHWKEIDEVRVPEWRLIWKTVSPGVTLKDVHVVDENLAIGVGESGRIIRTVDGGSTWAVVESGADNDLTAVSMCSPLVGTVVGYWNTILRTDDGGVTWISQNAGYDRHFYEVSQIDDTTAVAVGVYELIIRTTDGGSSWEAVHDAGYDLTALCFIDADTGWAAGYSHKVLRTEDGGDTWTSVDMGQGGETFITDIDFHDHNTGGYTYYGVGGGWYSSNLMLTFDGGETWDLSLSFGGDNFLVNYCLAFLNAETCVYAGNRMYRTTNGGSNWSRLPDHMFRTLYGIDFHQSGFGVAVGSSGVVFRTLDSGASWWSVGAVDIWLNDVQFVSADMAIAVGRYQAILTSTDGGSSWHQSYSTEAGADLFSASFVDPDAGMVAGQAGSILGTTDRGSSWTVLPSGVSSDINDIEMIDRLTAVAACADGTIIRTSDGGTVWSPIESGTPEALNAVFFSSPEYGTIVGQNGTVLRTSNGGTTWTGQPAPTAGNLNDVVLADDLNGIAVGDWIILRTSDGGASWETLPVPIEERLLSAEYTGGGRVIVVGEGGLILCSNDWGDNWTRQFSGSSTDLRGISFRDWQDGIIVGWDMYNGTTILRTSTGGE